MMEDLVGRVVSLSLAVKLLAAALGIVVIHISFRLLEKRLPRHFSRGDARYRVRKFVVFLGYVIGILFMAFGAQLDSLSRICEIIHCRHSPQIGHSMAYQRGSLKKLRRKEGET